METATHRDHLGGTSDSIDGLFECGEFIVRDTNLLALDVSRSDRSPNEIIKASGSILDQPLVEVGGEVPSFDHCFGGSETAQDREARGITIAIRVLVPAAIATAPITSSVPF